MPKTNFKLGDHKALCDICGRAYKGSDLRMQWDDALACYRCYDRKHPDLDPIIAPIEDSMVYDARPRSTTLTEVNVEGISTWGGIMFDGTNYGTEQVWELMNVTWDESGTGDLDDIT